MKELKASVWHPVGTSSDALIFVIVDFDVSTTFKTWEGAGGIMTCANAVSCLHLGFIL